MTQSVKPKVVHVSSAHPFTDNRIHYRECASLADAGYEVSLVATTSAAGRPDDSNVHIVALAKLPRLKRVTIGSMRAVIKAVGLRGSIYHLHDPELVWAIPVLRLMRKKVIYDAHEDLVMQVEHKKYLRGGGIFLARLAARFVIMIASTANHIVAATEPVAARFPARKTAVVKNYPPLNESERHATPVLERSKHVVYVGAIDEQRGIQQMLAATQSQEFPSGWSLVAAGPAAPGALDSFRDVDEFAPVQYRGIVGSAEARALILQSRVGLVVLQSSPAYREALPTKMFEYFAAGVPVVASDFPLWRRIVEESECGLLVDETSPDAIASAVSAYSNDPDLLARHSRNARRAAVERYNWAGQAAILRDVYEALLAKESE